MGIVFFLGILVWGGFIVIGGGFVFMGVIMDNYLCVFDVEIGCEFWKGCLFVGG